MTFNVVFLNDQQKEFKLDFTVYKNSISQKWFACLIEQCQRQQTLIERDRFYNFPETVWTEERLVEELNKCISIINSTETVIHHSAFVGMPQEQLNILHHYFENLRGGVLTPANYFQTANDEQQTALERYNVIIHRAENFYLNNKHQKLFPRIVCRFPERKRHELSTSDYDHFTLVRKFGEVYINYCEVGKPLYDVFKDGDDIVGDDNIRPLKYYSPDFTVSFHTRSKERVDNFLDRMNTWWEQNNNYLTALGFTKNDPKNAIGNIPVAMLNTDMSNNEVINKLSEYNTMDRVEINES